jgi:hypothetical protein
MTESTLNAEHRRALAMLATAGLNGATQSLLSAHGFGASLVEEEPTSSKTDWPFRSNQIRRHPFSPF